MVLFDILNENFMVTENFKGDTSSQGKRDKVMSCFPEEK